MQPTFGQIIDTARTLHLGAPASVFPDDLMLKAAKRAVDELTSVFAKFQLPAVHIISTPIPLPAGDTELVVEDEGMTDFGPIIRVEERPVSSTDPYTPLSRVDILPQRAPESLLREYTERGANLQFIGATQDISLRIHYHASGASEFMEQTDTVAVPGALNFLAAATAAIAGPAKGYTTEAKEAADRAYGPGNRNPAAVLGGYLELLTVPKIRALQKTPIAPRMFRAGGGVIY